MLGLIRAICFDVGKSRDPPGQNGSRILHRVATVEQARTGGLGHQCSGLIPGARHQELVPCG